MAANSSSKAGLCGGGRVSRRNESAPNRVISRDRSFELRVTSIAAGRFAVFRFSGARSAKAECDALEQLQAWMKSSGLASSEEPLFGYFDPPWTPSMLRHNEVMLRVVGQETNEKIDQTLIQKN